jgi:excisionase family DNA binding protein
MRQLARVKEISELTGFQPVTIYRMAREGRIPAVRVGRSIRFDREVIEEWLRDLPEVAAS